MDTIGMLTLAGLAVTVAVGVVTFLTYRRQFPKRQLRYTLSLAPILNVAHDGLEVAFRGERVTNPHLATLWLRSASRADIPTAAFDSHNPIRFIFDRRVIGVASQTSQDLEWLVEGSELRIPPQLVPRGASLKIGLVVEGHPGEYAYDVDSPLIDIQLVQSPSLAALGTRALTALLIASSSMTVVVAGLLVAALALDAL